ncbi:MAG: CBS domain-containing protein [Burkholderiales bacterium]|nr:CBS domain-containing protein [Burkholderiales bacterium]
MTDLRTTTAVTITPDTRIEVAEERMRRRGVRMLFVLDSEGALVGLVTASDLLGEKPLQFIERQGGVHREILVADIMTPRERLEVLKLSDVLAARIGHIVSTLQRCGRQHALVVDTVDGREMVRGLFSASRIARQLGMEIITTPIAQSFAEIEQAFLHFGRLA